jgi:hypothetical protein
MLFVSSAKDHQLRWNKGLLVGQTRPLTNRSSGWVCLRRSADFR